MKVALTILLLLTAATAQAPPAGHQRAIIAAWKECGQSITAENKLLTELTKSFQSNPPWRVVDAREPMKRAALIDKIIAEHKRRILLLERIKAEDSH